MEFQLGKFPRIAVLNFASMVTLRSWRLLNGKGDAKTMKVRWWSTKTKEKI